MSTRAPHLLRLILLNDKVGKCIQILPVQCLIHRTSYMNWPVPSVLAPMVFQGPFPGHVAIGMGRNQNRLKRCSIPSTGNWHLDLDGPSSAGVGGMKLYTPTDGELRAHLIPTPAVIIIGNFQWPNQCTMCLGIHNYLPHAPRTNEHQ